MVIDRIENAPAYFPLHPLFNKAFASLSESAGPGKYEFSGSDIKLIIEEAGHYDAEPRGEAHRKYIDIQIALEGNFNIGWSPLSDCTDILVPYDAEKDIEFFSNPSNFEFALQAGFFAIFFPEDVHYVMPPREYIKKAILKVPVQTANHRL